MSAEGCVPCALNRRRAVKVDHLRVDVGLGWAFKRAEWKECNGHVAMDSFAGLVGGCGMSRAPKRVCD
jgi:hypothetical protein